METLLPLPEREFTPARPSALGLLVRGFGTALARPNVLLLLVIMTLLMPLVVVVPVYQSSKANLSSVQAIPGQTPIDLPNSAPAWLWSEWQHSAPGIFESVITLLPILVLCAALWNLLVTGGWMAVGLKESKAQDVRTFFRGGVANFLPFLMTWLLGIGMLAVVTWLVWATPGRWLMAQVLPEGKINLGVSETTGRWLLNAQSCIFLFALLHIEVWLDLARASIATGHKKSALKAVWQGCKLQLRHPVRISILVLGSFALEAAWIGGVEVLRRALDLPVGTLLILLPIGRQALRGGRYISLARFCADRQQLVNVKAQPSDRIGSANPELAAENPAQAVP